MKTRLFVILTLSSILSTGASANPTVRVEGSTTLGNGGLSTSRYSPVPADRVLRWCGDRLSRVRLILQDAAMAKLSGADRVEVVGIYENGLKDLALDTDDMSSAYSLTHRSIVRGVALAQALEASLTTDEIGLSTRIHFLENYMRFIQDVAANLDIPYYIPYYNRGGCRDCAPDLSEEAFSQKLLEMAKTELDLVLDTLASRDPNGRVYPKGTPTAFLVALEFTTYNAALDLDSSLLYTRLACVISQLSTLNGRLARYNSGNQSEFRGREDWAFQISYNETRDAIHEISHALNNLPSYSCQAPYAGPQYSSPRYGGGYPVPEYQNRRN